MLNVNKLAHRSKIFRHCSMAICSLILTAVLAGGIMVAGWMMLFLIGFPWAGINIAITSDAVMQFGILFFPGAVVLGFFTMLRISKALNYKYPELITIIAFGLSILSGFVVFSLHIDFKIVPVIVVLAIVLITICISLTDEIAIKFVTPSKRQSP